MAVRAIARGGTWFGMACGMALLVAVAAQAGTGKQTAAPARDVAVIDPGRDDRLLAERLAAEGSPRSLALAAILSAGVLRGERNYWSGLLGWEPQAADFAASPIVDWRVAAETKSGMDPVANSLLAIIAARADDPPSRRDAAHRWANAEPANLAPVFYADADPEALLQAARTRHDFDAHLFDDVRWAADAIARHPVSRQANRSGHSGKPRDTRAVVAEVRAFFPVAQMTKRPDQQASALLDACRDRPPTDPPSRRSDCLALGRILRDRADLAWVQWIGVSILKAVETDPAAMAETTRIERRMLWQDRRFRHLFGPTLYEPRQLHRVLAEPTIHRDQDAVNFLLAEAHIPLDPPADWRPPR